MKETIEIIECPKCGKPIPALASQGLCPNCALAAVAAPTEAGQPGGNKPAPPPLEAVAAAFPQLEILELIGAGGMGCVFKARQPKLERLVALKLLTQTLAADAAFTERFHREARLLARLNHPGIVSVYDYGESGGFFFLLMEFVDGVNLRQAMRAGRFTPAQALNLVPKICESLQFAHDEGVLHRDIKPENILLDTRGRLKIADFGIAKLIGEKSKGATLTASGLAIGTPHYMAPEQLEHPQDVDQRADIYSLGVVFYEMLTGELPIGRFAPPSAKTPVDPRVDHIVLQALEKERERRQQNAADVKTEVEQITSGTAAPATGPSGTMVLPSPRTGARPHQAGSLASGDNTRRATCYFSTPERMRNCFPGASAHIFLCDGELQLDENQLTFTTAMKATIAIPLERIHRFGLGLFRMWNTPWLGVKYARLNYLIVIYAENDRMRTVMLTPVPKGATSAAEINSLVAAWHDRVQDAILARTRVAPTPVERNLMLTGVQGPWLRVILPLLVCFLASLAATFAKESAGPPVLGVAGGIITLLSIGYFKMNSALERGNLDAVTSDEPPSELLATTTEASVSDGKPRLSFWWTASAWAFIGIGLLAVVDTLAMVYRRPFHFSFYPGWAHLFAGVALLTLSRRWRVTSLVVLVLVGIGGAWVGLDMIRSGGSVVMLPAAGMRISVAEEPFMAAAGAVFLTLVYVWPWRLLTNRKARTLFNAASPR